MNANETRPTGVLTGNEIWDLGLIKKGDKEKFLKAVSYDLRLGGEVFKCGEENPDITKLEEGQSVHIQPFGMILFSTEEEIDLQTHRDIVGRFDLKIGYGLEGLIVQVGTQIEPGYRGPLFGFLINAMGCTRTLSRGQDFLTVEFSRLNTTYEDRRYKETYKEKTIPSLDAFLSDQAISRDELKEPSIVKTLRSELESCRRDHDLTVEKKRTSLRQKTLDWARRNALIALVGILVVIAIFLAGLYFVQSSKAPQDPSSVRVPSSHAVDESGAVQSPEDSDSQSVVDSP